MTDSAPTRRPWLVVGALLAVLIVLVAVLGTVIVVNQAKAAEQLRYERCLAAHGYTLDDAPNIDLEGLAAAAEECSSS